MNNEIPPMTHELGRYWDQPSPAEILLDDTHALMERDTFKRLAEYSCSIPTGTYEGKMWKRHDGAFDHAYVASGNQPVWFLCWYGPSPDPDRLSINMRAILLV